ncbi:MAG TPA: hypothetical protein DIT88_00570, partial [Planctomycetaceae bacterium]|nr:hypothetical protein [Planctomycetaceae bacterium]
MLRLKLKPRYPPVSSTFPVTFFPRDDLILLYNEYRFQQTTETPGNLLRHSDNRASIAGNCGKLVSKYLRKHVQLSYVRLTR